jgi:autotransporter-associated beta strand protein
MKARSRLLPLLAISASIAAATTHQFWNVGGTGGDGIWGTGPGDKNWNLTPDGSVANTTWPDPSDHVAVFQDSFGGTVTVFDPVQAGGIRQTGADYTVNAGVITLVNDATSVRPSGHVQAGTLTINSVLAGTAGLAKTGPGTLRLASANTFTGTTAIDAGTLNLTGSLASTDVQIATGATLTDANGGLAPATVVTNAGTLNLSADDTITNYLSNGGSLTGSGTLTANTAELNKGSFVSGSLAAGDLKITGEVTLSGFASATTTTVQFGTLVLTGTLASPAVSILAGATLGDSSGGLAADAAITNAGTLSLGAPQTVASYTQNGTGRLIGGGQRLTTTQGATLNGGSVTASLWGDITSTGDVLITGPIGGGTLAVTGGLLTLNGVSTNPTVTIAANAGMLTSAGRLGIQANLTNAGTLTVTGRNTLRTYVQEAGGTLAGSAELVPNTATLNGGTIAGILSGGTITSTGDVLVSGAIDGRILNVTGGILNLTGTATLGVRASIAAGATLLDAGGGLDGDVVNAGTLAVNAADTIESYIQNGSGSLTGSGVLTVTGGAVLTGGTIAGALSGHLTSTGDVLVSGTLGGGPLNVTGGTLTLSGISNNPLVAIASGATVVDESGSLATEAVVTNAGELTISANDTITTYLSNGGVLSEATRRASGALAGRSSRSVVESWAAGNPSNAAAWLAALASSAGYSLTATDAFLNDGSLVSSNLIATTLTSNGAVTITGSATADRFNVASGTLTNTGVMIATSSLDLAGGSRLVAGGAQSYALLTTSGSGAGTWQGDLTNPATVAPGGVGGIGTLRVTGNFTNAPTGTLALDAGAGGSDGLAASGTATFGGTLALSQAGAPIPAFVPLTVVAAAAYAGNFTALTEDLDGAVWFNPVNGTITRILPPACGAAFGATRNQGAVWASLYDDVIDPGSANITLGADGLPVVTSGVASGANPDLLWALAASFTPAGLNAAVLNRLSPEVYTGLSDYAVQATRTHQRTALDAPALARVARPQPTDSKGGSKAATVANPGSVQWDLFGAIDHFNVNSDSSADLADYELDGTGFIAGVRGDLTDWLRLAWYAAVNEGTVTGPLVDADASGFSLGLLGELLLNERRGTRLTAGLSYGTHEFDGSRGSVVATAGGWQPGRAGFSNAESDAVELFIGIETVAWHTDRFRLIPAIGLRQAWSTMDSIAENAGGPGGPLALAVGGDSHSATLAEVSLLAEAALTDQLTLRGIAGFNAGFGDDPHALKATLSPGGRPFGVTADGLTGDAFFLGLGAEYLFTETIRVGLNYRADFRDDADVQQVVGLSSTFRF